MNKQEAIEWLTGYRSMVNNIPIDPYETWQLRIAQGDAAMIKQAYYVLRAYNEGLLKEDSDGT